MSHMQKSIIIIIFCLFSLAVLSGFSNHAYLQNRQNCIEPFQEPWLITASDLICKTFLTGTRKCCQQINGNVMNWTCLIYWTVFLDAQFISLSLSLSLSHTERLYYCMSYCLVNCVLLYI